MGVADVTPLIDEQYVRTLAATLDALPEQVVRYRIPDLTIVYCNVAWATWYHLEPNQVLGRTLDEFLSEDGKAGLAAQLALLGPDNLVVLDTVLRDAPNAPGQWVEWVDRYMPDPAGDEVLAVGRDVTARHLAETRLAESETRFRTLADDSTDVIFHFVLAPYPHFDYMSPSVENVLGYLPSYFLEEFRNFLDIISEEDRLLIHRGRRW